MNKLIISIGSNTPDKARRIADALTWLALTFRDVRASEVYRTEEYHRRHPDYFNCVAEARTELDSAADVTALLKDFECRQGRTPQSKISGLVPVDLDLVIFNDSILRPHELEREYFLIGYRQL